MSNVISLGATNPIESHMQDKIKEVRAGEITGIILFCQYSEEFGNAVTEEIIGEFPADQRDRRNLTGALEDMKKEVNDIDTDIHDYD